MKKFILIFATFALPSLIFAQTISNPFQALKERFGARKPVPQEEGIKTKINLILSTSSATTSTSTLKKTVKFFSARFSEVRNERINQYSESMIEKLSDAILRVEEKIKEKETRVQALKAQGIDTEKAEARLAEAKSYLASAKEKLDLLPGKIQSTIEAKDPRQSFPEVRDFVKEILSDIRKAHDKMVMSLTGVNWVKSKLGKSTTTSATTTP